MSEPAVDAFLYLLGEVFDGRGIEKSNESQALLINHLRSMLGTDDRSRWQKFEDASRGRPMSSPARPRPTIEPRRTVE
jgi:hypothetical protein